MFGFRRKRKKVIKKESDFSFLILRLCLDQRFSKKKEMKIEIIDDSMLRKVGSSIFLFFILLSKFKIQTQSKEETGKRIITFTETIKEKN